MSKKKLGLKSFLTDASYSRHLQTNPNKKGEIHISKESDVVVIDGIRLIPESKLEDIKNSLYLELFRSVSQQLERKFRYDMGSQVFKPANATSLNQNSGKYRYYNRGTVITFESVLGTIKSNNYSGYSNMDLLPLDSTLKYENRHGEKAYTFIININKTYRINDIIVAKIKTNYNIGSIGLVYKGTSGQWYDEVLEYDSSGRYTEYYVRIKIKESVNGPIRLVLISRNWHNQVLDLYKYNEEVTLNTYNTWENRPSYPFIGETYFCTSINNNRGELIVWDGLKWVDTLGNSITTKYGL